MTVLNPQTASPHIVIDREAKSFTYGPVMYSYDKADVDEIKTDMMHMCRERAGLIEELADSAPIAHETSAGRHVATVGEWREWLAKRQDG